MGSHQTVPAPVFPLLCLNSEHHSPPRAIELQTKVHKDFTIPQKSPTRHRNFLVSALIIVSCKH